MTPDIHPHWKNTDLRPDGDGACPASPAGHGLPATEAPVERWSGGNGGVGVPEDWPDDGRQADGALRGKSNRVPIVQDDDHHGGQPPRNERCRWKMVMPFGVASMMLLFVFVSGVNFLRANLLETAEEAAEEERAPEDGAPLPESPAFQAPQPPPTSPTPAPSPPVLDLGQAESQPGRQAAPPPSSVAWPSLLRVNRYTVGSGLIPAFPPTEQIPVNVIRETREQLHSGAPPRRPLARSQPQTGPAVWVLGVMSLGMLPLFLKRRVSK